MAASALALLALAAVEPLCEVVGAGLPSWELWANRAVRIVLVLGLLVAYARQHRALRGQRDVSREELKASGTSTAVEVTFMRATGERFPVRLTVGALDVGGEVLGTVTAIRDVSEERRAADALAVERDFGAAVLSAMREGYVVTRGGTIVDCNAEAARLTGFSREELVGVGPPYPFWPPEQRAGSDSVRRDIVAAAGGDFDLELRRRDGTRFSASLSARPASDPGGAAVFVTTIRDVTVERRRESDLAFRAEHDALTGLLNRGGFDGLAADLLEQARLDGRDMTLALLDVDHFKAVNDEHGHPAGDAALATLARRLQRETRGEDVLARLGGEEFAWLLVDASADDARRAVDRARTALSAVPVAGIGTVTMSAGLCGVGAATTAEALYATADRALYEAKRGGRDRVVVGLPADLALPRT